MAKVISEPCTCFPYELSTLHWDNSHARNKEELYCYCAKPYTEDTPMVQCENCRQLFHDACVHCLPKPLLFGDHFFTFQCSVCTQAGEKYERANMSWVTIVHLVIYNLMRRVDILKDRDHKFFRWKEDLCAFVEDYWDYLAPEKAKSITWHNTIASVLSTQSGIFLSGFDKFQQAGWWSLRIEAPPDKNRVKATPRPRISATPRVSLKIRNATAVAAAAAPSLGTRKRRSDVIVSGSEEGWKSGDGAPRKRRKSIDFMSSDDSDSDIAKQHTKTSQPATTPTPVRHLARRLLLNQVARDFWARCDIDTSAAHVNFEDVFAPEMLLKSQDEEEDGDGKGGQREWLRKKVRRAREEKGRRDAEFKEERTNISTPPFQGKRPKKDFRAVPIVPPTQLATKPKAKARARARAAHNDRIEGPTDVILNKTKMTKVHPQDMLLSSSSSSSAPSSLSSSLSLSLSLDEDEDEEEVVVVVISTEATGLRLPTTTTKTEKDKPAARARTAIAVTMTPQEEWALLQRLEHTTRAVTPRVARFRRKLHVRRLKRNLGLKPFDLDSRITRHLRNAADLEPISIPPTTRTTIVPQTQPDATLDPARLAFITSTSYSCSFASRLHGTPRLGSTVTRGEPWVSAYHGRKLRPYIWRDYESRPRRLRLLEEIRERVGRDENGGEENREGTGSRWPVDYVYFQREHLEQVNEVLCRAFWPGIDVSENLQFPDFSVVALYRRLVVGCAFMTPEAYVTYVTVVPGWEGAGIGQFMLYHLIQTSIGKDVTLHVSANNSAMILYQKFGFKPEEFVVGFYDKYLPPESVACKNAFFVRLRR